MKKAFFYTISTLVLASFLLNISCSNDSTSDDQTLYENIDPAADVDPREIKKPGGGS